jgi:hypothetical protein
MLEWEMGNKNNKRFIIADKMYDFTVGEGELKGQIQYACHNFKKPRFTINDLQK